jgi:hypothetical protein
VSWDVVGREVVAQLCEAMLRKRKEMHSDVSIVKKDGVVEINRVVLPIPRPSTHVAMWHRSFLFGQRVPTEAGRTAVDDRLRLRATTVAQRQLEPPPPVVDLEELEPPPPPPVMPQGSSPFAVPVQEHHRVPELESAPVDRVRKAWASDLSSGPKALSMADVY